MPNAGDPYTGKELYEQYADILSSKSIEIDPWESLTSDDQEAWDELARTCTGV